MSQQCIPRCLSLLDCQAEEYLQLLYRQNAMAAASMTCHRVSIQQPLHVEAEQAEPLAALHRLQAGLSDTGSC